MALDADLAMLLAVAITEPLIAFIPLIRPLIMLVPALYRLTDAIAEWIPVAVLLALDTAWVPPVLTGSHKHYHACSSGVYD